MTTHRWSPHPFSTVQHGHKGRISYSRLAGDIEITVSQCSGLHVILVCWNWV